MQIDEVFFPNFFVVANTNIRHSGRIKVCIFRSVSKYLVDKIYLLKLTSESPSSNTFNELKSELHVFVRYVSTKLHRISNISKLNSSPISSTASLIAEEIFIKFVKTRDYLSYLVCLDNRCLFFRLNTIISLVLQDS